MSKNSASNKLNIMLDAIFKATTLDELAEFNKKYIEEGNPPFYALAIFVCATDSRLATLEDKVKRLEDIDATKSAEATDKDTQH